MTYFWDLFLDIFVAELGEELNESISQRYVDECVTLERGKKLCALDNSSDEVSEEELWTTSLNMLKLLILL